MCLSTVLTVVGGLCEIAGFVLVAVDLYRLQRHEFGPLWFERALAAVRSAAIRTWRKLTGQATTHYGSARANLDLSKSTGTASASMRLEAGDKSIEERIAALEANFQALDREVDRQRIVLNQAIERVRAKLDQALVDLRQEQEIRAEEERALRRRSLRFQWAGIPLFLLGVALSVAGNIATC